MEPPRPEYPRPQLVRPAWRNLNGTWELKFDRDDRGLRDGWERARPFEGRVVVPFAPGSPLSGVRLEGEPPPVVWYRCRFDAGDAGSARSVLRIGACDFDARVFLNGRELGRHRGGYTPIACEAGHALRDGPNELVLRVEDPDTWSQPRGKQATSGFRTPVDYDPVIGIWQTAWLEPLPEVSVEEVVGRWHAGRGELAVHVTLSQPWDGEIDVSLRDGEREVARAAGRSLGRTEARLPLRVPAPRTWSPDDPQLYALDVTLRRDARVVDRVASYAGLREIATDAERILLNGRPLYLRGILDQGYFPGGWYTAASDDHLRRDVELVRALGLNCARKHQKLEDPRWLHWADRLGLLVWGEMPSGRDFTAALAQDLVREWTEAVRRDRASPSLVAWVPFNESWGVWNQARRPEERALVDGLVALTRALDPTRLVVGNDGWEYSSGDLFTLHLYAGEGEHEGDALSTRLARLVADPHAPVLPAHSPLGERRGALPGSDPTGRPVLLTECGGIGYVAAPETARGERPAFAYGALPETPEALEARIRETARAVGACPALAGFVWTQLTDVQQEVNGLLDFERRPKLPLERLHRIFGAVGDAGAGERP